jgi:hypothetical protein
VAVVFVQFVTDVMLDIIWVSRPNLAVEIHISGPNSLLIDRDSDLLPGSALHRGAKICPDLESDLVVIIREDCPRPSWAYNADLPSGQLLWRDLGTPPI